LLKGNSQYSTVLAMWKWEMEVEVEVDVDARKQFAMKNEMITSNFKE